MSLIANSLFGTSAPVWGGVDSGNGNLASIVINGNRFVTVTVFVPTPTPKPVTTVGGTLAFNTIWRADVTYLVTSDVTVPQGITLTIRPGTSMKFQDVKLDVAGTLKAEGTSDLPITFSSDTTWGGISLMATSINSRFSNVLIENVTGTALDVNVGPVTLHNSTLRSANVGLHIRSSQTSLGDNEIYSHETGVIAGASTNVVLDRHTIRNNAVGLRVVGLAGTLTISESNFMGNSELNIEVFGSADRTVTATGNWWGTADGNAIEESIHHKVDDDSLVEIVFAPFATARLSAAP